MLLLRLTQRKIAPTLILSLVFFQMLFASSAYPYDRPFNNAGNWLGTGLMEIPTARILDDGAIRVSGAQALPYRWYGGGMGIFPGFEFTGRLTEITNIDPGFEGQSTTKDKAFDIKYQVIPESKWLPALALGYHDLFGTQLFEAQYIVLSRQIFPFDFTLGYGTKRLEGFFGGIEVALHPRIHFMAEYNPIDYAADSPSARGVPEGAEWPVNFGLRCKLLSVLDLGVSYQRGDTLGVSLNLQTDLGKPIVPHRADPPPLVDVDRRPFKQRDKKEMVEKIHAAIHEAGFANVSVYTEGDILSAEFTNNQYLSNQKAVGRVLRILLLHAPSDTKKLQAIEKRKGIPIVRVAVKPNVFEAYLMGDVPEDIFKRLIEVETTTEEPDLNDPEVVHSGGEDSRFGYGVKPEFQSYLNDPSGFFKFRVGIKPWGVANLWKGGEAYARFDVPFYGMLAKEIEKDTFARAQTYYGFYVLDPPVAPDLNKKASPKRSMICILSVVVAFFVAIFLAFFLEYLGRLKTQEPDRYQQLKDGLRLRREPAKRIRQDQQD